MWTTTERVSVSKPFSKVRLHKNNMPHPIKTSDIQFVWYTFKFIQTHNLKTDMYLVLINVDLIEGRINFPLCTLRKSKK